MDYCSLLSKIKAIPELLNILVTGPQRSGTTIVANALAYDLGWQYIDEDDIGWLRAGENDLPSLLALVEKGHNYVIQGPACAHICHTLPHSTAVVFVRRAIEDILASQKRVNWQYEDVELRKYPKEWQVPPIAALKYAFWEKVQKPKIKYAYDVDYESLRGHELWIEKRQNFDVRQWRV